MNKKYSRNSKNNKNKKKNPLTKKKVRLFKPFKKKALKQHCVLPGFMLPLPEGIDFQDKETYERLKKGKLEWSGTAEFGGQVRDKGVRPQAEFRDGMYVDTIVNKGLMFEVTLGTQRLKYKERNKDGSCF